MAGDLAERIRKRIEREGPIPFSAWMEMCLYDPEDGYYMRPRPDGRRITGPGPDADFVTPPTLHPFFAECVAREIRDAWMACGRPTSFSVVEHGGGEGDLSRGVLAWADANEPAFGDALGWWHVERSAPHRGRQRSPDQRVRVVDGNFFPGTFSMNFWIACELLDAIPVNVTRRKGDGWEELAIDVDGGRFIEAWRPARRPPIDYDLVRFLRAELAKLRAAGETVPPWSEEEFGVPVDTPDGGRVLEQWPRQYFLDAFMTFTCGALIVDYGDRSLRLRRSGFENATVRGFRDHHVVEDVLADPGEIDITASVDFTATVEMAEDVGLREASFETMEEFLLRHGILDALNATTRSTREGASDYLRLRQLLLPTGLGSAFKVQRFTGQADHRHARPPPTGAS